MTNPYTYTLKYPKTIYISLLNACCKSKRTIENLNNNRYKRKFSNSSSILPSMESCKHYDAKKFSESKGFCCCDGEVSLIENDVSDELYYLFTLAFEDAKHFQTYIQTYSNTFAFTSFGVKYGKSLCKRNKGIYTFRVQGHIYHFINELLHVDKLPSYLQLYFYDTKHRIQNCMNYQTSCILICYDSLLIS